jgi:hypothetical protein
MTLINRNILEVISKLYNELYTLANTYDVDHLHTIDLAYRLAYSEVYISCRLALKYNRYSIIDRSYII